MLLILQNGTVNNNGLHYVVLINYQRSESRFQSVQAKPTTHTHTVIMVKVLVFTLYMGLYTSPRPQVSTGGLAAGYLE